MVKKVTAFSISEDVLARIDQMRGLASRSAVVEDILKKGMLIDPKERRNYE